MTWFSLQSLNYLLRHAQVKLCYCWYFLMPFLCSCILDSLSNLIIPVHPDQMRVVVLIYHRDYVLVCRWKQRTVIYVSHKQTNNNNKQFKSRKGSNLLTKILQKHLVIVQSILIFDNYFLDKFIIILLSIHIHSIWLFKGILLSKSSVKLRQWTKCILKHSSLSFIIVRIANIA